MPDKARFRTHADVPCLGGESQQMKGDLRIRVATSNIGPFVDIGVHQVVLDDTAYLYHLRLTAEQARSLGEGLLRAALGAGTA